MILGDVVVVSQCLNESKLVLWRLSTKRTIGGSKGPCSVNVCCEFLDFVFKQNPSS